MYLCGYVPSFKTGLKYKLEKAENALVFQVLAQSDDISAYLAKRHFMASNGLRIATSKYPEFKQSKNVIFLQGSDSSNDYKLDVTRFVGRMQRDNAAILLNDALKEFVNYVKKASYAYPVRVVRPSTKNVFNNGCFFATAPARKSVRVPKIYVVE